MPHDPPSGAPPSGALGSFQLDSVLGRGGMATVWRGIHRPTGVPVAVKVLDRGGRAPAQDALRSEIEAVAALHHPAILTLYDFGNVPSGATTPDGEGLRAGRPWLAMELASEGTLARRIGQLTWPDAQDVLRTLLRALAHAHAHGVYHRDIKPSNLLFSGPSDQRPGLKVADFGIASAGRDRFRRRVAGTPRYMAPEQIRAAWWNIGPWTDLYAVGGLAWELVTGSPPFSPSDPQGLTHQHLYDPPPAFAPIRPVPPNLEGWLRRLLAKPVNERFQRAADALWALDQLPAPRDQPTRDPAPSHTVPHSSEASTLTEWLGDPTAETHGSSTPAEIIRPRADGFESHSPALIDSHPPPLPDTWQPRRTPQPSPQLAGAGLGLFGLRAVPLVGRLDERQALWECLKQVTEDKRPSGIVIEGPPGVGKSALARWFVEQAEELGGAACLIARHDKETTGSQPLRRMVRRALRVQDLRYDQASAHIGRWARVHGMTDSDDVVTLTRWLFQEHHQGPFTSGQERSALLTRWVRALSRERPVVLWLDDLPWGPSSEAFAAHLLGQPSPLPVMVVMTAATSPDYDRPPPRGARAVFRDQPNVRHLSIEPLPSKAIAELLERLLPLHPELVQALSRRVEGNPLLAVQLINDWIQRELIEATPDGFDLVDRQFPALPTDLHHVWSGRVHRVLDGALKDNLGALEIAAALGRHVRDTEWQRAVVMAGLPLAPTLVPTLVRARLATPIDEGWRFAHGILHESVVQTAKERGQWPRHNQLIAAMLATLPDTESRARRGRHLLEADQPIEAAELLLGVAATYAAREEGHATQQALELAKRALDRADLPFDDLRRARWRITQARLLRTRRSLEEAESLATRAVRHARRGGNRHLLAEAQTERALIARARGDLLEARRQMEEAIESWRAADSSEGLGEALRHHAAILTPIGMTHVALEVIDEAHMLAARCDDQIGLALITILRGDVRRGEAQWTDALRYYGEARTELKRLNHRSGAAEAIAGIAEIHRYQGDIARAEHLYQKVLQMDEALGRDQSVTRLNLALCQIAHQRYREALPALETLERAWSADGRPGYLAVLHVAMLPCLAAVARWSAWSVHHQAALRLLGSTGFIDYDVAQHAELAGDLAARSGHDDAAREAWELALSQWDALHSHDRGDKVERRLEELGAPMPSSTHDTEPLS